MWKSIFAVLVTTMSFASSMDEININRSSRDVMKGLNAVMKTSTNAFGQKFVFNSNNELIVSNTGFKYPEHGDLGRDEDVVAAGYIRVAYEMSGKAAYIRINNYTGKYCLPFEKLAQVKRFMESKVPGMQVKTYNEPNREKCNVRF